MSQIAGLILAGGLATRMQGQDKGLVLFKDKPLVEHVIERLSPQVDKLWISANRHLDAYQKFGYPVFPDASEFQGMGPLAGLASLLPHLSSDISHVQLSACDTPYLARSMVQDLMQGLEQFGAECLAVYPALEGHVAQYSCVLVKREALGVLAEFLRNDSKRRIRGFLELAHAQACYGPSFTLEHMRNFNSHEDIANAES